MVAWGTTAALSTDRGTIADHALIGDTRTAALVDERGVIDWLCLPRFDGEPVFARLVAGTRDGGAFTVAPAGEFDVVGRRYVGCTTVVETEWRASDGALVVATDGMVAEVSGTLLPRTCLVRRIEVRGGDRPVSVSIEFDPRYGDERRRPDRWRRGGGGFVCTWRGGTALWVGADRALDGALTEGRPVVVDVEPGQPLTLVMSGADRGPLSYVGAEEAWRALLRDAEAWRSWCARMEYDGSGVIADAVVRSLITLRLLTYSPSGAPVAAPTTSLPESIGGARNWDYRYAWPRDASIGIGAFLGVGLDEQARAFLYWLVHASRLDRPRLSPLLTVYGRPAPVEREIASWPGFEGSRPVRFGNGARRQHQLDNYGWVLDALWLLVQGGHRLYKETWRVGAALADEVARRWREPDSGLWEVRGEPAHYVHSKAMAWLALDRAAAIASVMGGVRPTRVDRWRAERDAIATDVVAHGFDPARNTFVRAYGRNDVDAALLVLPILGMEPPGSPRVRGTIEAVRSSLFARDGDVPLLYRYHGDDGVQGDEGAFLPCSFWLVQALAAVGDLDEAASMLESLVALGGPLGLFAEEVDPATGYMIGNYPQALTHAALVQAALAVREARNQEGSRSNPSAMP